MTCLMIYPSVTYSCHTSIVTNTLLQPGRESLGWYWHRLHVKASALYDEVKKVGVSTAALLWPVIAKTKID